MLRDQPVRTSLRAATSTAHDRVDRLFSTFNLAQRADYGRFLQAQAAALLPLERALDLGAAPDLPIDWRARQRSEHLLQDLDALGLDVPRHETLRPITEIAAALGTLYVLEGSRLGGALLKRSVPAEFPTAFLSPVPASSWRKFLEILENSLTTPDLRAAALSAAEQAFALFESSARAFVRSDA